MFEGHCQYRNWVFGPEGTLNNAIVQFTPLLVPGACHSVYRDVAKLFGLLVYQGVTWLPCILLYKDNT